MKNFIAIIAFTIFLSGNTYSKEIYLSCNTDSSSFITLSYDNIAMTGREHVSGSDVTIDYELQITEAQILMQRFYEGKFVRSWSIDRYSGSAILSDKINLDPNDKSINTYQWFCKIASKKF